MYYAIFMNNLKQKNNDGQDCIQFWKQRVKSMGCPKRRHLGIAQLQLIRTHTSNFILKLGINIANCVLPIKNMESFSDIFSYFLSLTRICLIVIIGSTLITSYFSYFAIPIAEAFRTAIMQFCIYFFMAQLELIILLTRLQLLYYELCYIERKNLSNNQHYWKNLIITQQQLNFYYTYYMQLIYIQQFYNLTHIHIHNNTILLYALEFKKMGILNIAYTKLILISLFLLSVLNTPVDITLANFKQHFGCQLKDYQSCSQYKKREWFIMFMIPHCGHCKRALPQFQDFYFHYNQKVFEKYKEKTPAQIKQIFQGLLHCGIVNCQLNYQICKYFNALKFPTFVYITAQKRAILYKGARTVEKFMNFSQYHDPELHEDAKYGHINHKVWHDIWDAMKQRWVQFLVLGVVAPSLVGYCLGNLIFNRKSSTNKKKTQDEQKKQLINKQQNNPKNQNNSLNQVKNE